MLQKRVHVSTEKFRDINKREQKLGTALLYLISILVAAGILTVLFSEWGIFEI